MDTWSCYDGVSVVLWCGMQATEAQARAAAKRAADRTGDNVELVNDSDGTSEVIEPTNAD